MKKLLVTLVAVSLTLTLPATARAGKPDWAGGKQDEPVAGTSCADYYGDDYGYGVPSDDFTFTLGGKDSGYPSAACIDVMANEGEWRVETTVASGTVRGLLLAPQDSFSPGDSCGGVNASRVKSGAVFTLPGPDHPNDVDQDGMIEAAYVNSCGTDFAETVDGVVLEEADPGTPDPLAFRVFMTGSNDALVIVHVDLPPTQTE